MGVKARKTKPKGKQGDSDFDDPPEKEWLKAKFVGYEDKPSKFGGGTKLRFRIIDRSCEDLDCGSVWAMGWNPCYPGRPIYEWLNIISDGGLEEALEDCGDEEELDFNIKEYKGAIVDVFCERNDGGYMDVTDLRKHRRKKKSSSRDRGRSSKKRTTRSKKKKTRDRDEGTRRKKKRSSSSRSSSDRKKKKRTRPDY